MASKNLASSFRFCIGLHTDTHNSETDSQHVNKLRERLIEQVGVLKEGLKLFGEVMSFG